MARTRFAKRIILDDWIYCVMPARVLCVDRTSLRWIANTILSISPVAYVLQYSVLRIPTTNTMPKSIAITTILQNSQRDVKDVRRLF